MTNTVPLSQNAITVDHRLEKAANSSSEELARHRWHWTLDASNAKRVSIREYARAVGRSDRTIRTHVQGYAEYLTHRAGANPRTLSESIERAQMSTDKAVAVEAVAKANKVSFKTASSYPKYTNDVKRVREAVAARVEKDPDLDTEAATERIASMIAGGRKANAENKARRAANAASSYVEIEGELARARRAVNAALTIARDADLDAETVEFIESSADKLEAAIKLLRLAVAGAIDVDWDAEMIKIGEPS